MQATTVAQMAWDSILRSRTRFDAYGLHGTQAGYKVKIQLPYAELDPRDAMDDVQGRLSTTFGLTGCINAGDDDFAIIFT